MLYAMLAACAALTFVLAVPHAAKAHDGHVSFGAGGVGRDDGPPHVTPSAMPPGGPVAQDRDGDDRGRLARAARGDPRGDRGDGSCRERIKREGVMIQLPRDLSPITYSPRVLPCPHIEPRRLAHSENKSTR